MNHPEFSNTEDSGFFYLKSYLPIGSRLKNSQINVGLGKFYGLIVLRCSCFYNFFL